MMRGSHPKLSLRTSKEIENKVLNFLEDQQQTVAEQNSQK